MDIQDLKKKRKQITKISTRTKKDQIRLTDEGKWTLIVNTGFPFQSFVTSLHIILVYNTHCSIELLLYVHQKHLSQVITYCAAFCTHKAMCVRVHLKCILRRLQSAIGNWYFPTVHRCKRHFFSLKVLTTNLLKFSFITLLGSFSEAWKCWRTQKFLKSQNPWKVWVLRTLWRPRRILRTPCPIPRFRRLAQPRREDTCQS